MDMLVYAYNATVCSLGYSPFFIMFGRQAPLPIDVMARVRRMPSKLPEYVQQAFDRLGVVWDATSQALLRNSLHSVKKMDLKHDVDETFEPGDLVLLKKGSMMDPVIPFPRI